MTHFNLKFCVVILLVFLSTQTQIIAQDVLAPANGPSTGQVLSFAMQGTDLYAAINGGGLYKSSDGGLNWIHMNLPGNSFTNINYVMADDSLIFACGAKHYRSSNHGQSWQIISITGSSVFFEQICSFHNNYIGLTGESIYISDSSGQVWTQTAGFQTIGLAYFMLVVGDTIYLGASGVSMSTDSGYTWQSLTTGVNISGVSGLAKTGNRIFAGAATGVWETDNDGGNWIALSDSGLASIGVSWIGAYNDTLYCSPYAGGISFYDSLQQRWFPLPGNNCYATSGYHGFSENNDIKYAATNNGVYISNPNSIWQQQGAGMMAATIWDIASDNQRVLCATSGGLFLTTDEGASWGQVTPDACLMAGLDGVSPLIFISGDTILASYNNILYRRIFPDTNWGELISAHNIQPALQFIKTGGGIFVSFYTGDGTDDQGSNLYSDDGGQIWTNVTDLNGNYIRSGPVAAGNKIYGNFYRDSLASSSNQGANWATETNFPYSAYSLTAGATIDSTAYLATFSGVFYTSNGGQTWDSTSGIPSTGRILYLASFNGSLYGTNNTPALYRYNVASHYWQLIAFAPNAGIQLAGIIAQGNHLYIGTSNNSVYVYGPPVTNIQQVNTTQLNVKVFPNPAQNLITITATNSIKTAEFFNVLGERIMVADIGANTAQVNISAFSPGIYFVCITGLDFKTTVKLVKD